MKRRGKSIYLLHIKDARFGYLSRCSIASHHWDDFKLFLDTCDTANKLAYLIRDSLNLDYIQVIITVISCIGLYLIEISHSTTINVDSTHDSLGIFMSRLYDSLKTYKVDANFFQ